jgi:hypothetical protein
MSQTRNVLIFVDGLGIGHRSEANPLSKCRILGQFLPSGWLPPVGGGRPASLPDPIRDEPLPFGGLVRSTDASLGMTGLPQSATGQTTLFTGVNAALTLGHHLYGFPGTRLRGILMESSILKRAREAGAGAAFLNAYRPLFFELGEKVWTRPMSASTWNNRAAGLPFMTLQDLREEKAVYHDFTNRLLRDRGFEVPDRSPEDAGRILARAASGYDFSIYEFFLTDRVGHTGDLEQARGVARDLDRFLLSALQHFDLSSTNVILTSDHGNIEDMSRKSHTLNPVPTLVWGPGRSRLADRLARLEDFAGAILDELRAR